MSSAKEIRQLQKAKSKAQSSSNLKEEASLCNQLGEVLAKSGDYQAAIEEHRQELALSQVLHDVIGCAVANRKIGECYAELGNIATALKYQRRHLDLARSVNDAVEEQRALATIGRTYLFLHDTDQSLDSLKQAEDAFKKSLAIVNEHLEGRVSARERSEMRARLLLNLGFVCDGLKDPQRCNEFIRQSIYISEKNNLLEDLYRANFNLGNIHFRNGQHSLSIRCFEKSKECAHKMSDKYSESECFYNIGKVLLNLGDFLGARRSLKKAFQLGSQQPAEREAVKRDLRYAIRGSKLEKAMSTVSNKVSQEALGLAEELGDVYCKVASYSKALDAYQTQLSCAEALGKPSRELAVIHVSLAATYSDLRQYHKAIEHYRRELELRQGNAKEECETWLNIAGCQEESGKSMEEMDSSYTAALHCAEKAAQNKLQVSQVLALKPFNHIYFFQSVSLNFKEEEEQLLNSEPLDSDFQLSDSDEDMEDYDKLVSGRRKTGKWNKRNEKGETVLHRACIDGNLKQVEYLVEQGHPLNPRDYCGWTPLHEACNHGHLEIVAVLLDKGANINDPGGPHCEGVTPLHDALNCGHFAVARLLVQKGASVNGRNKKGDKPLDSLRLWRKTYSRDLDQETQQECVETEKLLRKAQAGGVAAAPVSSRPVLQDSQLFDAECSEPLLQQDEPHFTSQRALPSRLTPPETNTAPRDRRSSGPRHRLRGTKEDVLFGVGLDSLHVHSCFACVIPLRPVRPRPRFPEVLPPPKEVCPSRDVPPTPQVAREAVLSPQQVSGRDEYQRAMQNLGSAKSRLITHSLLEPAFTSTPAVSANHVSALVPEDEYIGDEWLEDDLGCAQPKKKRKVDTEQSSRRDSVMSSLSSSSSSSRSQTRVFGSSDPNIFPEDDPPQPVRSQPYSSQPMTPVPAMPAPIRMRVRVQNNVFLIPVPHSEADSCTVSWLCEQAAQRYYQTCGLLPRLSLQKEGALLSTTDLLLAVLHTNEEVLAEVCSWDLPPLPERYKKACTSLAVEENRRVLRLCEVQDGSPCVTVCGLGLAPPCLSPLLRALKLQDSLTELRLSANRLSDDLLPELISAVTTMPRLRVLDISANQITGEGLKKAVTTLEGRSEELDLSMNPLGDGWSQALACLLSGCPLLATLYLQACGLTARFLQQHRLLLASALTGKYSVNCHSFQYVYLQGDCSLSHLSLAANGLTDQSIISLARCLALCPSLVSLDLSANPSVTSEGLHSLLSTLREEYECVSGLLSGCQVCGPWDVESLDGLSERVQDLRLCSQRLNKLDQEILQKNWPGCILTRGSKCLLNTAPALQ
uniref:Tonsoku-like protein n=1 Tax=Astyanax mexicanus TaxID=7994 RepID=A0A8B9JZ89_ASTMX